MTDNEQKSDRANRAHTFVVVMGIVAMFGDMTYEGARGLVGPYLGYLGASAATIGFVAGLGEFLGYALRIFSGWLGDRTRAYWPLVLFGYSTNLLVVLGLAVVQSWHAAIALVLLERIGKAVRSPARSTLVSYAANEAGPGKSFGLDEALDQLGAVTGPLIGATVLWLTRNEPVTQRYRYAFAALMLPVLCNIGFALFARKKYPNPEAFEAPKPVVEQPLGNVFPWYLTAIMLLAFGFADWALVAYHVAHTQLLSANDLPVLYAIAMGLDGLAALAFGYLFDRYGLSILAVSSLCSAFFAPLVFLYPSKAALFAGVCCWAIGMGAQDSIFKAAIAQMVPKTQRSRAYGLFFGLFGLAWWIGSTVLGWLYDRSLQTLAVVSLTAQLLAIPFFLVLGRKLSARNAAQ